MKTDGLCFFLFLFTSLQLFTLPPHNFKCFIVLFCFFPWVRRAITFCQSRQPGVYCLVEMVTNEGAGSLRHVLANDRNVHVPLVNGNAYLFRVSLNTHLQCCHKCPSAAQESKTGFEYCRKKKKNQLAALQVCHPILWENRRTGMDGWKEDSTRLFSPPRYNSFCVIEAYLSCHSTATRHTLYLTALIAS